MLGINLLKSDELHSFKRSLKSSMLLISFAEEEKVKEENVKYKQVLNLITNKYQILVIKIRQKNELYRDPTINAFINI